MMWKFLWPLAIVLGFHAAFAASADSLPFDITSDTPQNDKNYKAPTFPILPFTKYSGNPILGPDTSHAWEAGYVFNPSAIVLNETIFLLYRAEDVDSNTSSIGLGWSTDGINFERLPDPIFYATESYETPGGTEDPRIIRVNGTFYLTYTGYDDVTARLCIATSTDLLTWTKYGPLFPDSPHSKSGAIIDERSSDGLYHMYHNDTDMYHAVSEDLISWTHNDVFARPVDTWDADLLEPGPAPIKTQDGKWLLVYNAKSNSSGTPPNAYSSGQMLIDPLKYDGPLQRLSQPFLVPQTEQETQGQVPNVVFSEGLVQFKGKWYLYFGQSDTTIGVATADVQGYGSY